MLSTGIKNSILIVLIILILHFFIKNVLLTKREDFGAPVSQPKCAPESSSSSANASAVKPANDRSDVESEKDVYNAWFGGEVQSEKQDAGSTEDLDKFFTGEIDIKKEIEEATKCVVPQQDPMLPKSSTCDPNLDKIPPEYAIKKDVRANCNIVQDKKGIMILNEYENENIMNGGALFMNLEAYDQTDSMFAPL